MSDQNTAIPPTWQTKHKLEGVRFGRLLVLGKADRIRYHKCVCDCGTHVEVKQPSLIAGRSRSCGCLHREITSATFATHRRSKTPEFSIWTAMLQRCFNPKSTRFYCYGGRGITVCGRWRESFSAFLEDMGELPDSKLTLDRIDTNGNYCPENCRWATRREQGRNRRDNHILTFRGVSKSISEWAEDTGMDRDCLSSRINKHGWDVEKALTTPVAPRAKRRKG